MDGIGDAIKSLESAQPECPRCKHMSVCRFHEAAMVPIHELYDKMRFAEWACRQIEVNTTNAMRRLIVDIQLELPEICKNYLVIEGYDDEDES